MHKINMHHVLNHLSAMTNPTLNRTPDAGKNGARIKVRAIPTLTRSLYERVIYKCSV